MNSEELTRACKEFKSPFYVYDLNMLNDHVNKVRNIVGNDIKLCYAIKANPMLVETMEPLVDRLEVCSPGELDICMGHSLPANKILVSGVNKQRKDVVTAFDYGVRLFTAESFNQMELLNDVSSEKEIQIEVFCRLNASSQFGMSQSDFEQIIADRERYKFCNVVGLHYFVGTQRKGKKQEKDLEIIKTFISLLKDKYDFTFREIEYGPGLYVPYFEGDEEFSYGQLEKLKDDLLILKDMSLTIEMGRYFVASCGYYITTVADTKNCEQENYAIVDGGINQVNYYGSNMGLKIPIFNHIPSNGRTIDKEKAKEWTICGSLCTTADVIIRAVEIADLQLNDVLCFRNVGAYSSTESIGLFLSRDLPSVVLLKDQDFYTAREAVKTSGLNMGKQIN